MLSTHVTTIDAGLSIFLEADFIVLLDALLSNAFLLLQGYL